MSLENSFEEDFHVLRMHYDQLASEHGDTAAAVQQSSVQSQDRRLEVLAEIGSLAGAKVLDFGCGAGRLLEVLKRKHGLPERDYTGYDLSGNLLEFGRLKYPEARFEQRDILIDGVGENFDYVFISGVFNNRISDNEAFIRKTLTLLFSKARKGLAFNILSCYVDYMDEGLYYADPDVLFRYCKEWLTPAVTLRHDYRVKDECAPFECTFYLYSSPHDPRKKLVQ